MLEVLIKEINVALKLIEENTKRLESEIKFERKEKEKFYKKYIEEKKRG